MFTPFWRRVQALGDPPKPAARARQTCVPDRTSQATRVESWHLEPTQPDWAGGLRETWTPGESAGKKRLKEFLEDGAGRLCRASATGPTATAPPASRRICASARSARARSGTPRTLPRPSVPRSSGDIDKFLSELGWREFCRHLLFDVPDLATRNLQPSFDAFPWRHDETALPAWQRGQTGYPIVDAGMRELWHTGVMHNRVRMVVASFLVKHLLIDWREGEKWFWDTLVDADAGSNPANWQWVAGSGADAAPYFRVFNPVLQGEKFDPDGSYVRRWVPELAELPKKLIHQPWEAAPLELASAGVTSARPIRSRSSITQGPRARAQGL